MKSRKNFTAWATEQAKRLSNPVGKIATSAKKVAENAAEAAGKVADLIEQTPSKTSKFDSDLDPNLYANEEFPGEYSAAKVKELIANPTEKKKKKKKKKKEEIIIENHPTTEIAPEDKSNPVNTQIPQPISAPLQSTTKNLKENLSKRVGALSSHLKTKQNKKQKSIKDLIKIANLLLKKKEIKNAFKYFDAIQERGVKINIPKFFSPKIAAKYFVHVITEKNDAWLEKYIGERRFLALAVPFIARHNNSKARKLETIRSKCREIAKRDPSVFSEFLKAPTIDPEQLKIAFGDAWLKEHIANEILNYVAPLIRDNPEMLNKAIEEAKDFLQYKYHKNYLDDITDKDITDLIIQQQKEQEDRRQSEIAKADSLARDKQKARPQDIDRKQATDRIAMLEMEKKKQKEQAEQQQQRAEKEKEKQHLKEEGKKPAEKSPDDLKRERLKFYFENRRKMWFPPDDTILEKIQKKAEEFEHLEQERRRTEKELQHIQQAQNLERLPQPPNAEPIQASSKEINENGVPGENNLGIQQEEQNKKDQTALNSLIKSLKTQIQKQHKNPNENFGRMLNALQSLQEILDKQLSVHEKILKARELITEIDEGLPLDENYDKFSHWYAFGKEAIAILKKAGLPLRIKREDQKAKEILDTLKTSITTQTKALEHKQDAGSRKIREAFQDVQDVLNVETKFPYEKLESVGKMIETIDKNLRKEIDSSKLSNWNAFGKIAVASITAIGIPIAMGVTQLIYGTYKFWSSSALEAGQARKSLEKLSKEIEASQKESPDNPRYRSKK
jgi:hypothetical protein